MEQRKIDRINELARKAKSPEGLTPEETAERDALRRDKSVTYNWHDPQTSFLEAVLARGDRRVAPVIEAAWRQGAKLDSWSEYFSFQRWMEAFQACGVDPSFYAHRARAKDEVLPWDMISAGVRREFLWKEREQCYRSQITPNCRKQCTGCGANRLNGGVCDG